MLCEMCGTESASLETRKVSGSVLRLCSSCGEMGSQTSFRESIGHRAYVAQALEKRKQRGRYEEVFKVGGEFTVDYGRRVRIVRDRRQ